MSVEGLQRVVVSGDAHARGVSYGRQAEARIRRSLSAYRELFEHFAGWNWDHVVGVARSFERPIRSFSEEYWTEICGIADGAGIARDDILAINLRTEIMFSAKARGQGVARQIPVGECTAVGVNSANAERDAVLAQNWDWLPHSRSTVILLEVHREGGGAFVTLVEAGLLAKMGMNSSGIAIATNAIVTNLDSGEPGVPYHVLLRAMLDSQCASDALAVLQSGYRSSSANYLIADADGVLYDVEATPGQVDGLYIGYPNANGVLGHTNHLLSTGLRCEDLSVSVLPDSPLRLSRCLAWAEARMDAEDVTSVQALLRDHANFPNSICRHEDYRSDPLERFVTVLSVVMLPKARELLLVVGNPCEGSYTAVECESLSTEGRRAFVDYGLS